MMILNKSIIEIIQQRFSCRIYLERPIEEDLLQELRKLMASLQFGPLGTPMRFILITTSKPDRISLKGLETYGFIKGASGFIVGAVKPTEKDLEDYGYAMERLILLVTALGLGTCWLGGSFTRGSFTRRISPKDGEHIPAVTSIGYVADSDQARKALLRRLANSVHRLPWENLFFDQRFGVPLRRAEAGVYTIPLDMVRLGPSASNKQPWRIIKDGQAWHFYLQRTKGYLVGFGPKLMKIADLQRVDMGIAMCHFELTAHELGISGKWAIQEPPIEKPDSLVEYAVSWMSDS